MSEHGTLEERLARSLETQAGGLHDAPFGLADVRGRARTIRRRRRGVAAGVVAALVAVGVPAALLAGPGDDRTDGVDPAPPTNVSAAVLHQGRLTRPGAGTIDVDLPSDLLQVAVLADGRIVAPVNSGGGRIRVLSPEGRWIADYPVDMTALETGVDDRTVAWVDRDGRVQVLESGVAEPVALAAVPGTRRTGAFVDAVLGADCAAGGCTVLAGDGTTTSYEVGLDGVRELVTSEPLRIEDVSPDGRTWAVSFPPGPDEQFGCSALYDVAGATVTARACDTSNLRFSLDGTRLTGSRSDGGPFLGELSVRDLDLREIARIEHRGGVVSAAGWQDADHLLVSVADLDGTAWSLLRVRWDGTVVETLEGPTPGELPEVGMEYLITQ